MSLQQRPCLNCGTTLSRLVRNETDTGWNKFNMDGSPHTNTQCNLMRKNTPGGQQQLRPRYFPVQKEQLQQQQKEGTGITLNSIFFKITTLEKEVKELKRYSEEQSKLTMEEVKRHDANASILDRIAQEVTLVRETVGYPKPEPISVTKEKEEEIVNVGEMKVPLSKIREQVEEKAKEEEEQEEPKSNNNNNNKWTMISEKFVCHSCDTFKHNGWEQWGTRICDDCKTNIDAQEALREINKTEEDSSHLHLRTPEDISAAENNDENNDM